MSVCFFTSMLRALACQRSIRLTDALVSNKTVVGHILVVWNLAGRRELSSRLYVGTESDKEAALSN